MALVYAPGYGLSIRFFAPILGLYKLHKSLKIQYFRHLSIKKYRFWLFFRFGIFCNFVNYFSHTDWKKICCMLQYSCYKFQISHKLLLQINDRKTIFLYKTGFIFHKSQKKDDQTMQIYAPDYYKKFTCIADKCSLTCCQEWKIAVDDDTYDRWRTVKPPADMQLQHSALSEYTYDRDGQHIITLNDHQKCPFLQKNRLCRLVLTHGDSILSETCTMFPREKHDFSSHAEASLMPGCPAVLDLWQTEPHIQFPDITSLLPSDDSEALLFQIRDYILQRIQNTDSSLALALMECFYLLSELPEQHQLSEVLLKDYFSTETLAQLSDAIQQMEFSLEDMLYECNELLQDLAVNYEKEGLYTRFLTPLLTLAAEISEGTCDYDLTDSWKSFHVELEKYEPLLRAFLANEMYSDLLLPEGNLDSMLIHMQWIGMEYASIRYGLFLSWLNRGQTPLAYETVRETIAILTRMTGYEDDDIYEYLENSFESLYWEWGYFAMILADIK